MRYPGYDAEPDPTAHLAFVQKGPRPPDYDAIEPTVAEVDESLLERQRLAEIEALRRVTERMVAAVRRLELD